MKKLEVSFGLAAPAAFLALVFGFDFHAANATAEIREVESRIDRTEAETLARVKNGSGGDLQKIELLGKLLLFDRELSVNKNEACAFCHMPETGFTGPVSSLNASTVAYPGSVRTRFSSRKPQSHTYAVFAPALHYNESQGDFVGGNFWDMRATGTRLNNPVPEQAQGPPLTPVEMGLIDSACMVYRISQRPYRPLADELWGPEAFAIHWPSDVEQVCAKPGPAAASDPFPVHLNPIDRGSANRSFDQFGEGKIPVLLPGAAPVTRAVRLPGYFGMNDLAMSARRGPVRTVEETDVQLQRFQRYQRSTTNHHALPTRS